jgi:hypothetical protein
VDIGWLGEISHLLNPTDKVLVCSGGHGGALFRHRIQEILTLLISFTHQVFPFDEITVNQIQPQGHENRSDCAIIEPEPCVTESVPFAREVLDDSKCIGSGLV